MLLAKLLLSSAIPEVPHWVAQEMAKVEHRRRLVEMGHRYCRGGWEIFFIEGNPKSLPYPLGSALDWMVLVKVPYLNPRVLIALTN